MDELELTTLRWIGRWLGDYERLLSATREVPEVAEVVGSINDASLFVARHYTQALRMRARALEAGHWVWWCASTYGLCHDWTMVRKAVPWLRWGCWPAKDNPILQSVAVIVGGHGWLWPERAEIAGRMLYPDRPLAPFRQALDAELIATHKVRGQAAFVPGPQSPKPSP